MTTIAFFNNKGGVGKTTLVHHLAWMLAMQGVRVLAADLDPQANLTAASIPADRLEDLENDAIPTIYDVMEPVVSGDAAVRPKVFEITEGFGLLLGDLRLSFLEDALSAAWADANNDNQLVRRRGLRVSAALAKAVRDAMADHRADVGLIDVGPNLGAINRAALVGADHLVVPVSPDLFSIKGLTNVGESLRAWRAGWTQRSAGVAPPEGVWPTGDIAPLGYVVSRFTTYDGAHARSFGRWMARVPEAFHAEVLGAEGPPPAVMETDPSFLAGMKDYHSLMAMAHEARKPVFLLKPADGAIGGHQGAVRKAHDDFRALAIEIMLRARLSVFG